MSEDDVTRKTELRELRVPDPAAPSEFRTIRVPVTNEVRRIVVPFYPIMAPNPSMASDPDAALVRLAAAFVAGNAEAQQLEEPYYNVVGFPYPPEMAARLKELSAQHWALRQQIADTPATTSAGFRAKAAALMPWLAPGGLEDAPTNPDEYLAYSLCRDLLALTTGSQVPA